MNKKTPPPQTDQDLIQVFADLFDAVEPETPEEIDAVLVEGGYDPNEVGSRMQAFAEQALAKSPLNWRNQADTKLQAVGAKLENFRAPVAIPPTREQIIDAIKELTGRLRGRARLAQAYFRNFESASDEDLASLLSELQFLTSEDNTQGEEKE